MAWRFHFPIRKYDFNGYGARHAFWGTGKQKVTLQGFSCVNIFLSIWSICSKRIHIINIPISRKCYSKTRVSCVHFSLCTLAAIGVIIRHSGWNIHMYLN